MLWVGHILDQIKAGGEGQLLGALCSVAQVSFWTAHLKKKLSKYSAGLTESSAETVPPKCRLPVAAAAAAFVLTDV